MNGITAAVLIIVAIFIIAAIVFAFRHRKDSCTGNCQNCKTYCKK